MAEVTLTPIPYNGGTLRTADRGHMCRLGGDRYLTIYHQSAPYYTFGMVSTITGIKTATPTVTTLRTQVIPEILFTSTTNQGIRLFRLSNTKVLALYNIPSTSAKIRVLNIDETTNVITCPGNELTLSTNSQPIVTQDSFTGMGQVINENLVLLPVTGEGSNAAVRVKRIVIDGFNVSASDIVSFTSTQNTAMSYFSAHPVPNSTNWVCSISTTSSGNYGAGFQTERYYGDPTVDASWTKIVGPVAKNNFQYLPLTETTGLYIEDSRSWYHEVDGVVGPLITFGPTATVSTASKVMWAKWITPTHFIIANTGIGYSSGYNGTGGRIHKIVKYVDPTFGETSTDTQPNTILFNNATPGFITHTFHNSQNNGYEFYDNETILVYGAFTTTTTQFRLGVITLA